MGLREDAIAAAQAAGEERETTARQVLTDVLGPTHVDGLQVVAALNGRLVFCGDEVCLAVRDQGNAGVPVTLVTDAPGWTWQGDVTSLAALGVLLARLGA